MAALCQMPGAMERSHDNHTVTVRSCLRRAWLSFFELSDLLKMFTCTWLHRSVHSFHRAMVRIRSAATGLTQSVVCLCVPIHVLVVANYSASFQKWKFSHLLGLRSNLYDFLLLLFSVEHQWKLFENLLSYNRSLWSCNLIVTIKALQNKPLWLLLFQVF